MKKMVTLIALGLFTLGVSAQDGKASCCSKKSSTEKKMTASEIAKCKAKCKAEGKTCSTTASNNSKKACCAKA